MGSKKLKVGGISAGALLLAGFAALLILQRDSNEPMELAAQPAAPAPGIVVERYLSPIDELRQERERLYSRVRELRRQTDDYEVERKSREGEMRRLAENLGGKHKEEYERYLSERERAIHDPFGFGQLPDTPAANAYRSIRQNAFELRWILKLRALEQETLRIRARLEQRQAERKK